MKRRTAIRNVIFFSAGAVLMPSCVQQDSGATIALKNIKITGAQEKLLTTLADFILPSDKTPGAIKLASQQYILMMVDDCYKKEDQDKFVKGLQDFNDFAKKQTGNSFEDSDAEKRKSLLSLLETKKDTPADVQAFYDMAKKLTIQSFTGSKYYLTEVRRYELVPSRFHGSFPVTAKS